MHEQILVPVDESDLATAAAEYVVETFPDAEVVLLHVIDPAEAGISTQDSAPSFPDEWYEQREVAAEKLFDELEASVTRAGAASVTRELAVGRPANTIAEYAEANDVDQIVMGSHGRSGVTRILVGSAAETVVRRAPVPVTVVR